MKLKKLIGAAGACLLLASTGIAQANTAQALSVSKSPAAARVSTEIGESNEAAGGFIAPLLAALIVAGGVWLVVDDNDDPDSP